MIGIFDSGAGGLTVLRAIKEEMPSSDIIYFGDIKHAPYGERSRKELSELTVNAIRLLQKRGATSIVSACNSVSASLAVSLYDALALAPDRLIEMVGPTVSALRSVDGILLAATPATIESGIYQNAFSLVGKDIATLPLAGLAGAIEFGREQEVEEIIMKAFQNIQLGSYRVLVLACTHYPLALGAFRKAIGDSPIFDPANAVAARVKTQLWPREVGEGKLQVVLSAENPAFRAHLSALNLDRGAMIEVLE